MITFTLTQVVVLSPAKISFIPLIVCPSPQVVDLGCGECSLLKRLKFHREIELLVGVDINGAKVKKHMYVVTLAIYVQAIQDVTE